MNRWRRLLGLAALGFFVAGSTARSEELILSCKGTMLGGGERLATVVIDEANRTVRLLGVSAENLQAGGLREEVETLVVTRDDIRFVTHITQNGIKKITTAFEVDRVSGRFSERVRSPTLPTPQQPIYSASGHCVRSRRAF
jgi:hypothetical protein